jgi:hypothetical protein
MELPELKKAADKLGADYIAELTKQLINANKVATGKLLKSLDYQVIEVLENILIRISSESYLTFVDKGRKPGKMPPISPIKKWISVKKIKGRDSKTGRFIKQDSLAFLIARSIGKNGIKPTNVIKKSIDNILRSKKELLGKAAAKDVSDLMNKILINK